MKGGSRDVFETHPVIPAPSVCSCPSLFTTEGKPPRLASSRPTGEPHLVRGLTFAICSATSRIAALPEPLSWIPGPR